MEFNKILVRLLLLFHTLTSTLKYIKHMISFPYVLPLFIYSGVMVSSQNLEPDQLNEFLQHSVESVA